MERTVKKKTTNKVSAASLFKTILESGITVDEFIAEAHKNGIDLKFGVAPISTDDPINPSHYQDGDIETIDFLQAKATPEEFEGYCKLNAIKYLSRAGKKVNTSATDDKKKAVWYLNRSIEAEGTNAM
jgi:hypothetical protein